MAEREMEERFTLSCSLSAVHAYRERQCEGNCTASQPIPPAAGRALLAAIFSLIVTFYLSSVVAIWLRPVAVGVRRAQLLCKTGLLMCRGLALVTCTVFIVNRCWCSQQ